MLEGWLSFLRDPEVARKKEFLASMPLFEALGRKDLPRVLARLTEHTYRAGDIIFQEGDIGRALFIVASGRVELYRVLPSGGRRHLGYVSPGGYFGEMAVLHAIPRAASATAAEETKTYLLDKKMLEALMLRYPAIGLALQAQFHRSLAERFLELSKLIPEPGASLPPAAKASASGEPAAPASNGEASSLDRVADLERALVRLTIENERLSRRSEPGA